MKEIYIVLTHTGTLLSKIIKYYTKDEFSHCSISLDKELNEMYSFGRLHPYNAFLGGFVHEYIDKGTFKRFYKTRAKIYSLKLSDDQYEKMKEIVMNIQKEKEKYKFNILGLFLAGLHIRRTEEYSFYCAEFVKYVIENAGVNIELPEIIKPEDFKYIEPLKEVYSGLLNEVHKNKIKTYIK